MKVIDLGKLFGKPFEIDDIENSRLILLTKYKKISGGEKTIVIKNSSNPYKVSKGIPMDLFSDYWDLRERVMKRKISFGSSEYFNYQNMLIKKLGPQAINITEINTTDPRFISLWNYNKNIFIKLHFKDKLIFEGNYKDFELFCPEVDVRSRDFYRKFLFPFPSSNAQSIKGFGPITFKKYVKNLSLGYQNILEKEINFRSRKEVVDNLIKGIA